MTESYRSSARVVDSFGGQVRGSERAAMLAECRLLVGETARTHWRALVDDIIVGARSVIE